LFTATHSPQLVFLRNQLWNELFQLFSSLLSAKQGFDAVQDALFHCGQWPYFATLMLAIQNDLSTDLRYSALTSLMSLLSHEINMRSVPEVSHSLQNLLDGVFLVPEKQNCHATQYKLLKQLVLPLGLTGSDHHEAMFQNKASIFNKHSHEDHRNMSRSDERMLPKQLSPQSQAATSETKHDSSKNVTNQKNNNTNHSFSSKKSTEKVVSDVDGSPTIRTEPFSTGTGGAIAKNQTLGAELCSLLLHLYEIHSLPQGFGDQSSGTKGKTLVTGTLSNLLAVSREAKKVALSRGLLETLLIQLRELHIKLSLESAENLRRVSDKKRVSGLCLCVGCLIICHILELLIHTRDSFLCLWSCYCLFIE
jgi:hypothetical protein